MTPIRLVTYDPGHFHAALVQKEMYPGVDPCVHVYAPLGADLVTHMGRVAGFNARADHPTAWRLEVHAGPDPLDRLLREKVGNVVVFSGRNRGKIDAIRSAVGAGFHVLADKPWVIDADDLPKLQQTLDAAEARGLVAYDIMTERYEITSILQRELVNDPEVFGETVQGSEEEPGVFMESVHYLMKVVAGVPNRRPGWFFDVAQQGEGLTDVGTHLVDLVMWILFPGQGIATEDVDIRSARRWPTLLSRADYEKVTGEGDFPEWLRSLVGAEGLAYYCNTLVSYTVRGVHVKLNVLWNYEAEAGAGDSHLAIFRGSRSRVEVRQGPEQNYRPELYVVPAEKEADRVGKAMSNRVGSLQRDYPGVGVEEREGEWRVKIPETYRVGHEAHFGEVTRQFLKYLEDPKSLPSWEKANMLAKYATTTQGVQRAHKTA